MEIRDVPVPRGTKRRCGKKLKHMGGVTVHNTGNTARGANADANARYQKNSASDAVNGWHFTVDEKEIIRSIPEDEIAEHCGSRRGNDTTVAIEICDNADGDISRATENGAKLAAYLLRRQGYGRAVWKQNLFQHHDWSGKNCPQEIRAGIPYGWTTFISKVNAALGASSQAGENNRVEEQPAGWVLSRVLRVQSPYMRGDDVVTVQTVLKLRGFDAGAIDGVFGTGARAAAASFQQACGITADGVVGKDTCLALGGIWGRTGSGGAAFTLSRQLKLADPPMRGEDVKAVQQVLDSLGFTLDKAGVDGVYGSQTKAAVVLYQRLKGLVSDGVIGEKTCVKLGGAWIA